MKMVTAEINELLISQCIAKVQSEILTSNNIFDRQEYPYYHSHESVPELLWNFQFQNTVQKEEKIFI